MEDIKEIISHLKDKGFIFSGSSIYGGLANAWDFGPLGTLLKNNIKKYFEKNFIQYEENIFSLDSGIILNSNVWKASGHIDKFNDPLVDCKKCKQRFRSDKLIEESSNDKKISVDSLSYEEQQNLINKIKCPSCGAKEWTNIKSFNLMFKTSYSKIDKEDDVYLRPETAQGIFINFNNIVNTMNPKIPFGVAQLGKSFRNEVTPGNFIFRTREFEQFELEYFTTKNNSKKDFENYRKKINSFLESLKINKKNLREYIVPKESLAHYSLGTIDFEYKFPFGWGEILGLANRGDFDLKTHSKNSNEKLEFLDQANKERFIPYVIETSFGVERLFLLLTCEHLIKETVKDGDERMVFKLPYELSPYKVSVMPLTNALDKEANDLYKKLLKEDIGYINYSTGGSIGKRYRKQDAIGTFFSITYDFDSKEDNKVTIRNRNTMKQDRILISDIKKYILKNNG